jgi:hypothetical protein
MQQAPAVAPLAFISIECAPRATATHRQHGTDAPQTQHNKKGNFSLSLSLALQRESEVKWHEICELGEHIHTLTKRHLLYLYDWHQKPHHHRQTSQITFFIISRAQRTSAVCLCAAFCLCVGWQLNSRVVVN